MNIQIYCANCGHSFAASGLTSICPNCSVEPDSSWGYGDILTECHKLRTTQVVAQASLFDNLIAYISHQDEVSTRADKNIAESLYQISEATETLADRRRSVSGSAQSRMHHKRRWQKNLHTLKSITR